MPDTSPVLTTEQRLAIVGLGHRRDRNSVNDGKHIILDAATGRELGRLDVFEAIAALTEAWSALSMDPDDHDEWEREEIMQEARRRAIAVVGRAHANGIKQFGG